MNYNYFKREMALRIKLRKRMIFALMVVVGLVLVVRSGTPPVLAAPNDVVINEIMYNPLSDDSKDEYVELYNTTASAINLDGWCFTEGISLCFSSGVSIAPSGYILVSPDSSQTAITYGSVTVAAEYSGSLSNSGERVTLKDSASATVSSVEYKDMSPWPITPDGTGPSLELVNPSSDPADYSNWGASIGAPTPGAVNSIHNRSVPKISDVSKPSDVAVGAGVNITAKITGSGITAVDLMYVKNFDTELAVPMYDDGAHGDGAADDGVYGVSLPGQVAGTLMRYKIVSTNGSGDETSPRYDDSQGYHGYYVADPSVASNAPIVNWFISDADFTDMHTNHVNDDFYMTSVVVYGNAVYDNSKVRIKGEFSRTFPKKGYKVKLPKGYTINMRGGSERNITEFHLNSDYATQAIANSIVAWWAYEQAGMPVPDVTPLRLERNGQFEGLYVFAEKYEKEWQKENGYDKGELWEDFWEAENNASDPTARDSYIADMRLDRKDTSKLGKILDQTNIPMDITYMATKAMAASHDHSMYTNTFTYRSNITDRWELWLWDFDLDFQGPKQISPYEVPGHIAPSSRPVDMALYDQPEIRQMYLRRLRTLADKLYSSDQLLNKYREINDTYSTDITLDIAKWPDTETLTRTIPQWNEDWIKRQKLELYLYMKQSWGGLPASQTDSDRQQVSFAEVVPDGNSANEYVRLKNDANTAVDVSGWQITGINYTLPAGAVIPAHGSIHILRNDIGYRAGHSPVLVAGQYSTNLADVADTKLTLKTDTGMEVAENDY